MTDQGVRKMKAKRRWMKWILEDSAKAETQLPWARATRPARTRAIAPRKAARA
ncbi:MAG: hypothetical protein SWN98_02050 [Pseudomonadota bacterium]|jgi:hypothetical protein|nr:hypothetical protein [Pseudomonadota bacterium]|tara:strand:- start:2710 stop:2868 length:159 start_codon:yes stop_codon:yes gene_type:complete